MKQFVRYNNPYLVSGSENVIDRRRSFRGLTRESCKQIVNFNNEMKRDKKEECYVTLSHTEKIVPVETLQSMFDEPSRGSNATQYFPAEKQLDDAKANARLRSFLTGNFWLNNDWVLILLRDQYGAHMGVVQGVDEHFI